MGHTIAEKILARHSGRVGLEPGEYIWATVDQLDAEANHFKVLDGLGIARLANPDMVWVTSDHYAPAPDERSANHDNLLRKYVRQYEIRHFFEYGRHGISHQLLGDHGALLPGSLSATYDSHGTSGGVFNCFSTPIGSEVVFVMATGRVWLRVPETIRLDFSGALPARCYGKDVVLALLQRFGAGFGNYRVLEFGGSGLGQMSIASRWSICNMGIDMGAKAAICEYDEQLCRFLAPRTPRPYEPVWPDPDCRYVRRETVNLSVLEPLVACPHDPSNVHPAREVEGWDIRVNQVFLGSCTNGRLEDLEVAAEILKGREVHPGVRMIVSPASQAVWREATARGLLQTLAEAGALVSHSTCGPCFGGHLGVLGEGDVCMSSSSRNYQGRMGSARSFVYLGSAATVAAAAVAGKIIDPRNLTA
jgi:3-isopropylmalate/(R)-2-methylmalate dehydratase large subunit